jgi:hypothetical protein
MDKKVERVPSTTLYMELHPGSVWLDNLCERKLRFRARDLRDVVGTITKHLTWLVRSFGEAG